MVDTGSGINWKQDAAVRVVAANRLSDQAGEGHSDSLAAGSDGQDARPGAGRVSPNRRLTPPEVV